MKKTNSKPRPVGGVQKDLEVRPKVKALSAPSGDTRDLVKRGVPKISKLNTKNMRSIFGDNAENIMQLLEADSTDSAMSLIYKKSLQTLIDLLPYAEHAVRKSKGARGVYQINSLISSMRELMTDIQSSQDRGMLGESLVENVMRPAYQDLATEIVKEYAVISNDAKGLMTSEDYEKFRGLLVVSRGRVADAVQQQYVGVRDRTRSFLQR